MMICPICLEPVTAQLFIPYCHHVFHYNCIMKSFETDIRCPICRREIDGKHPKDKVYVHKEIDGMKWTECIDVDGNVISSLPLWI
jgi:endogenous inhibitor of DNA gyrase (YacG/DUF329 family)